MTLPPRALQRIEELAAEAPPLTADQRARLAVILNSANIPVNGRAQVSSLGDGNDRNGGPDDERIPA